MVKRKRKSLHSSGQVSDEIYPKIKLTSKANCDLKKTGLAWTELKFGKELFRTISRKEAANGEIAFDKDAETVEDTNQEGKDTIKGQGLAYG